MQLKKLATLFLFSVVTTAAAFAQADQLIDDFKTGHYQSPLLYSGGNDQALQHGTMLGGNRVTFMQVCIVNACSGLNGFNQPASYGVYAKTPTRGAGLVQSGGYANSPSLFIEYGVGVHLNENFTPYDRIRVNFYGLTQPMSLRVIMASLHPDAYAQGGCIFPASKGAFSVEIPLDKLNTSTGFDLAHIADLGFFLDGASPEGASFALASIEFSDHAAPGAISCHP